MSLLEKLYDEKFDFKKSVELSRIKSDMSDEVYHNAKESFYKSLKTDEQKKLFLMFETCVDSRLETSEKEAFLNGFSCGLKIGVEINNRVNDFNVGKNYNSYK